MTVQLGYARVSTSRQEQSLDTQREALLAAGCDPDHFFHDTISGRKWQRPGLDEAIAYARPGDVLVVTRLDRLGRGLHEVVQTIADLAERGIAVRSLDPQLDTSRPADKVVAHVMLALAEWERDLLVTRTREGVAHARAAGRVAGPKPKLSAEQVHLAARAVEAGESVSSVARSYGVSRQTLYRALDRVKASQA
ncbi:recombinase family protein [Micrococcus luteus]|nr:recombinase family protein [Micrococcus luteus]